MPFEGTSAGAAVPGPNGQLLSPNGTPLAPPGADVPDPAARSPWARPADPGPGQPTNDVPPPWSAAGQAAPESPPAQRGGGPEVAGGFVAGPAGSPGDGFKGGFEGGAGPGGSGIPGGPWEPQREAEPLAFSEEELDLDDTGRPRTPMIIGGVVVAVAVILVGVFIWPGLESNNSNAEPSGGNTSKPPKPAKATGSQVEGVLEQNGFSCYETLQEPVPVHSCYATVGNTVPMEVRIQLDGQAEVAAAQLYASLGGLDRDTALKSFDEISTALAAPILGNEQNKLPTLTDGREVKEDGLRWGSAAIDVADNSAVTEFIRSGAKVAEPEQAKLPKSPEQLVASLKKLGYDCKPDRCEKSLGKGKKKFSFGVAFGPTTVRMAFRPTADKAPLPEDELETGFAEVIGLVTNAPNRQAIQDWMDDNHDGQSRRGDFEDLHAHLLWGEGSQPELTLSTPVAWN